MEVNNSTTKLLVPIKIFCYKKESSLQQFVKRSNFEDLNTCSISFVYFYSVTIP